MSDNLQLILSTVPLSRVPEVQNFFEENGFVKTILYLVNSVWDEETLQKCQKALKDRDSKSEFYDLLFIKFKIEKHYKITDSHRDWVVKSYRRLKDFVPNMTEDDAKIHDLSKYNFVQSIGYTAKWVHNMDWSNESWQKALHDHYSRESHHPQFCKDSKMTPKDLEESLVDMVACRWERDLQGNKHASLSDLVDFNSKFLERYVREDYVKINDLITKIKSTKE